MAPDEAMTQTMNTKTKKRKKALGKAGFMVSEARMREIERGVVAHFNTEYLKWRQRGDALEDKIEAAIAELEQAKKDMSRSARIAFARHIEIALNIIRL